MRRSTQYPRLFPLIVILFLVLVTGKGQAVQCLITANTSILARPYPDISGDTIVWEDSTDGSIHRYDLATGIERRVAPSSRSQHSPAVSGSLIAWQEGNPWGPIRYHDLLTETTGDLTPNGSSPAVSGQRIVWVNYSYPDANLALFDENDPGTPRTLVSNGDPFNEHPAISEGWVTWANGSQVAIYSKNLSTGAEALVASDPSSMVTGNPAISGDRVVWQDDRNGLFDIFLADLLTGDQVPLTAAGASFQENPDIDGANVTWVDTATSDIYLGLNMAGLSSSRSIISSGSGNNFPRVSRDRVVWETYNGAYYDISLYTAGSMPCPAASFTATPDHGMAPLEVRFAETSGDPNITRWHWEFGDGSTSDEQTPRHTYSSRGAYSVSLTTTNPVGRAYTSVPDFIKASVVYYTYNRTYGVAPLPVQFTDLSSDNPTGWAWNFGDGSTSTAQNPIHTYTTPGTFTVSLAATNANGTGTKSIPGLIRVLNGTSLRAVTDITGLQVTTTGSRQEIALDTTIHPGYTLDPASPASFSFTPPSSSGWRMMTFSSSDGIGFARDASGVLRGNLSSCTLESLEIVPATFGTGVGSNLPISYQLRLTAYPVHAEVNTTVWDGVLPDDYSEFWHTLVTTSRNFTSIMGTAYTLDFVTKDLTGVWNASLSLPVSSDWVKKYGNQNNITVVRLGGDGIDEVLDPSATFTDSAGNLDSFTIPSPHGLSRFALVSATGSSNIIQMGAHVVTKMVQSGGRSSSDLPSARDRTAWEQPAPPAKAPEPPAAIYYGEGKLDTTPAGLTRAPVVVSSDDLGVNLAIGTGTEALDVTGTPLSGVTARPAAGGSIPPAPPGQGSTFTGIAYDLGPDGATFSPPATVSFTVPGSQWNPEARYSIGMYSVQTGSWEEIPTSVDPARHAVSGRVSHLCLFGLFAAAPAGAPVAAEVVGGPAAGSPGKELPSAPHTPLGIFMGFLGWIYTTATANLLVSIAVLLAVLVSLYAFTRRSWLSRHRTWITLYLASLTGLLWAIFLLASGGPLWESAFILVTVIGLNLIVHVLRFDRVEISLRAPDPFRV